MMTQCLLQVGRNLFLHSKLVGDYLDEFHPLKFNKMYRRLNLNIYEFHETFIQHE